MVGVPPRCRISGGCVGLDMQWVTTPDGGRFRHKLGGPVGWNRTVIVLAAFCLQACTSREPACQGPSYAEQLASRPIPQTDVEQQSECAFIRGEIARMQSLAQGCSAFARNRMEVAICQAPARDNIAALESRAANIQCSAAFSNSQGKREASFDQCFERCQRLTDRTKEQCFDSCNK